MTKLSDRLVARRSAPFGKAGKAAIDQSARRLLAFLEHNETDPVFRYPFSGMFPTNCCESVSLMLLYLLEEKYSLADVTIIKGKKPKAHEFHYWVLVGDCAYDLTAHQFSRQQPIIGKLANTLHLRTFSRWELEHGRDFVEREVVVDLYKRGVIPF